MANLKDLIVRGVSRFTGKIYATDIEASGNITAANVGAAAAKGVATSVVSGGTDLPTAGAVYDAIDDAVTAIPVYDGTVAVADGAIAG